MRKNTRVSIWFLLFSILLSSCDLEPLSYDKGTTQNIIALTKTSTVSFPTSTSTRTPTKAITYPFPLTIDISYPYTMGIYEPESFVDNIIKTIYGRIMLGEEKEHEILIDSTNGRIVFSLFWRQGELDINLVQPDGQIITPNDATNTEYFDYWTHDDISYKSGPGKAKYYLLAHQIGEWRVNIIGKEALNSGSDYFLQITSMSAMNIIWIDKRDEYYSNEPISLSFGITGGDPIESKYNQGLKMEIIYQDPENKIHSIELYDDGAHGDKKRDDGIYSNIIPDTKITGDYLLTLLISGKINYTQEEFTREYYFIIQIE